MGLNIKTEEAHRLAKELAELTGETMTEAVTEALRQRLLREKRGRSRDEKIAAARRIAKRFSKRRVLDPRDPDDILYDERGLPA